MLVHLPRQGSAYAGMFFYFLALNNSLRTCADSNAIKMMM